MEKEITKKYCRKSKYCNCTSECNSLLKKRTFENDKCYLKNLNLSQIEYLLEESYKNVYLNACPGSGKTEVLAIKVAEEIIDWNEKSKGIAILTFTNSAENEIKHRISEFIDISNIYPHYIGTFTSWLHGYIAHPFLYKKINYTGNADEDKSLKVIDNDNEAGFLNSFSSQYGYNVLGKIKANEFYFSKKYNKYIYCGKIHDGKRIFDELLSEDEWRYKDLYSIKKKFYQKGFCLYEDIENLVYDTLNEDKKLLDLISKRFPIIFIDECQDLSYIQLEILRLLLKSGVKIHLIGDLNQSIYEFRIIELSDIKQFIKSNSFYEMKLNENYRSCKDIVNLSNYIVKYPEEIIAHGKYIDKKPMKLITYDKNNLNNVIKQFINISRNNNIEKNRCKIIVRNNSLKREIYGITENTSINTIEELAKSLLWFKHYENIAQFNYAILAMGKSIQMTFFKDEECLGKSNYYRPKCIELSEWKKIIFEVKRILMNKKEILYFDITWKLWKEKIKNIINGEIIQLFEGRKAELGNIRKGKTNVKIKDTLKNEFGMKNEISVETIHNCKGMSIDSVLLLTPKSANSDFYWKKWIDNTTIEEENRFAYVAISRAKYLLFLAIPNDKNYTDEDKEKFKDLGFEIIE